MACGGMCGGEGGGMYNSANTAMADSRTDRGRRVDERLEALDKAISEQSHLLGMLAERLGSALRPEHPKANDPDNLKVAAAASPLVDRLSQFIAAAEEHNQRLIRMLDLLEL